MPVLTLRGSGSARYGTLQEPLPWDVTVGGAAGLVGQSEVSFLLSYDTLPSTNVFSVTLKRRVQFRIDRVSEDRLASNVGVALLDSQRQRIGTLVSSYDGKGETYELKPGTYLIVASNFIPETIDITLRALVSQAYVELGGVGQSDQGQYGDASETPFSVARLEDPLLAGVAEALQLSTAGSGTLLGDSGSAWAAMVAATTVDTGLSEALLISAGDFVPINPGGGASVSMANVGASEALRAPFQWVDDYGVPITGVQPLDYDVTIHRRSDYEMIVSLRNPDDSPLSLAGLTIAVELWDVFGETKHADLTILASPGPGVIYALLEDTQTLTLPDVVYMRTLLTDGSGNVAYPLRGRWTLIEGYTT